MYIWHLFTFSRQAMVLIFLSMIVSTSYAHLGSCEDHDPFCRNWALQPNFCATNLLYMARNCPVSCNVCLDRGCYDRNPRCIAWAKDGHCDHEVMDTRELVRRTCPHSCNTCDVNLDELIISNKTIIDPDFECGRPVRNPEVTNRQMTRNKREVILPPEVPIMIKLLKEQKNQPERGTPIQPITRGGNPIITIQNVFCGATLIHERFLVTAAHCLLNDKHRPNTVRVGDRNISQDNETNSNPVDYTVDSVFIHPDYDLSSTSKYNDIALIKTIEKVEFNDVIFPFCIPNKRPAPGELVTVSGFGYINKTSRPDHVQEAELRIVDATSCENAYKEMGMEFQFLAAYPEKLQGKGVICASYPKRDACPGDSGGPMFQVDASGRKVLVGVVSTGLSCSGEEVSGLPGFYVSVADHVDFIDNIINNAQLEDDF